LKLAFLSFELAKIPGSVGFAGAGAFGFSDGAGAEDRLGFVNPGKVGT